MARGRMLNKTVCASLKFDTLPDDTCRLMATWTIAHLDKAGVFYADPAMVRSSVFPRRNDVTTDDVAQYLGAIERAGLMIRFDAKGDVWQWWSGFTDNQAGLRADRETTDYPQPPSGMLDVCRNDAGIVPDSLRPDARLKEVKGSERKGKEEKVRESPTDVADAPPVVASPPSPAIPSSVPDPSRMPVKEVARLDLDKDGWRALGKAESKGKNRAGVKEIVERKLREAVPAVEIYRELVAFYPDKALWPDIVSAVGQAPDDLELWGRIIRAWIGNGWNKRNVDGMLESYQRREIPRPKGSSYEQRDSGRAGAPSRITPKRRVTDANTPSAEQLASDRRAVERHLRRQRKARAGDAGDETSAAAGLG